MVFVELDHLGVTVIVVRVVDFLLLLIGVYPVKSGENSLKLIEHGFFAAATLTVNLVKVFAVMFPFFSGVVGGGSCGVILSSNLIWPHAVISAFTLFSAS